ncbi:MAG: c-type cytochrome [Planctomycetes bacterium]|nr:c-type cytochrome [Planctomycetota bacterium]
MADRGDTHYHVPTLNRWFAISAVLLLIASVWMVIDDWDAPWKAYQAEFRKIEAERTREALASDESLAQVEHAAALQAEVNDAQQRLDQRRGEKEQLEQNLFEAKGALFTLSESTKKAKQELAWDRFQVEEHRVHSGDMEYGTELLATSQQHFLDLDGETQAQQRKVDEFQQQLKAMEAELAEADSQVKGATKDLALLEKKLDKLDPEDTTKKIANVIRDFPGLDFIDPRNKVQKQVLADLTFELNFTKGKRIDMCQTCHLASDREGFTADWVGADGETLENPFLTHPRLDLYLTAKSPHPVNKVGCTICHRGSGQALSFQHVDHRAANEEQAAEWHEKYHWHKQHHWDYPMLSSEYVEASCVQCHKDTMELIADDAPRVAEGYRLFEDKGCYACHKVEWFPTKRKPGPSLTNLMAKLNKDWIGGWVSDPTAFRPSTRMPRIFNLSNIRADEEVAKSQWGAGRSINGREWEDSAIASVTAYLESASPRHAYPKPPVEGDAERGREVFRVAGCLACHNMAGFPGEELETRDFAFELHGENEHGPNLRGVATKVDRNWLFAWIKNPSAYSPETQMPNLRLSDQDAADVTAYLMDDPDGIFKDVPQGWKPGTPEATLDVLQEQARWFFARLGRPELERRFAGEVPEARWDRQADLLVAVGEKFIGHQGCFSCHQINGFEGANPIGTELTTWGSKTPDKLDWAFLPNQLAHEHGWSLDQREEFKQYRENWLEYKLEDPRRFDLDKVKNPIERQRMPNFGLKRDEILAIATFVVGLVDDEVQRAKMVPTPGQKAMNDGMQVVRQQNCRACHMVDPGTITFRDEEGDVRTVAAELLPLPEDPLPLHQRDLAALQADIKSWEDYAEETLSEVGFRLLDTAPEVGFAGDSVYRPTADILDVQGPDGGDFVQVIQRYYSGGIEMYDAAAANEDDAHWYWNLGENGEVEDVDGQLRLYAEEQYDKVRWTFAPPVLFNEGHKLQRDWFYAFLRDPSPIRRQMRVKMPTFNISAAESGAVADYFANKAELEWAPRYTKSLRTALGTQTTPEFQGQGLPYPQLTTAMESGNGIAVDDLADRAGLKPAVIENIEAGSAPDIAANFPRVKSFGDTAGFHLNGPVNPEHELIARRQPSYHAKLGAGRAVAVDGVNCFQCHWLNGQGPSQMEAPVAWAPDLGNVRNRLRPDWVEEWLWNPALIYPGTAMPANFSSAPAQYQEAYPDSSNAQQVSAVLDWLFNLDRAPVDTQN